MRPRISARCSGRLPRAVVLPGHNGLFLAGDNVRRPCPEAGHLHNHILVHGPGKFFGLGTRCRAAPSSELETGAPKSWRVGDGERLPGCGYPHWCEREASLA